MSARARALARAPSTAAHSSATWHSRANTALPVQLRAASAIQPSSAASTSGSGSA
jgi:hypothetical protein